MANPKHIDWLLEGVEAWNERRGMDPFEPDFEGVNLYNEFSNAGKLDTNREIPLARVNLRGANLHNANLFKANLEKADLSTAVCVNASLEQSNLTETSLDYSDFTGATFMFANLTNAYICDSDLGNANLRGANLTGVHIEQTTLSNAHLGDANLTSAIVINSNLDGVKFGGTNFRSATLINVDIENVDLHEAVDLTNVNVAGTQPWKANLYSTEELKTPGLRADIGMSLKSVGQLLEETKEIQDYYSETATDEITLYFRGESNWGWNLQPAVMRNNKLKASEGEMLRELISRRPEEFARMNSSLEQWVLAQHHGLPTRFLDVTRNPLVALFNACKNDENRNKTGCIYIFAVPKKLIKSFNSDTVSIIANIAKLTGHEQTLLLGSDKKVPIHGDEYPNLIGSQPRLRLHQSIQQEKPYFENRIDIKDLYKVFVVEPQQSSERIRAQSGAFLASAFHQRFERDEILRWNNRIPVYADYKLEIPSNVKGDIMRELGLLNITDETLSPGLDSSAEVVRNMYSSSRSEPH